MKLQIIKAGKQTDSAGIEHNFNEKRLKGIASKFDTKNHKPPLVIGHPKADDPALGWIQSVEYNEATKTLDAEVGEFVPAFAEALDKNMYKRWSVSLYPDDNVRHLGFLGAMPPAIKGLSSELTGNYSFSEDDEKGVLCFDFGENEHVWDFRTIGKMFRGLREWIIAEKGVEVADKVIPDYNLGDLENKEFKPEKVDDTLFNENTPPTKGDAMTPEEQKEFDRLTKENKDFSEANKGLTTDLATSQAETAAAKEKLVEFQEEAGKAEHKSFCESLVAKGQMKPADVERNIKNLVACSKQDSVLDFGESGGVSMLANFKATLENAQVIADFSEQATNLTAAQKTAAEDAAQKQFDGQNVDVDKVGLFNEAEAHAKKHNVTFEVALEAIETK